MVVFWNEGVAETNAGLDILGVRGADQSHEARLTGGITTISARARYLSLLPWFLDEWYRRALEGGRARHDEDAQAAALRRLEKVVLLATVVGKDLGETGDIRGVLGSDLWAEDIAEVERGGSIDLTATKGGASLGTYVQPCIQLRLLLDSAPLGVPAAGRELADARREALRGTPIVDSIFRGGTIDRATAVAVAPHFSINGLLAPESARERDALAGFVTVASTASLGLGATVRWALAAAAEQPVAPATLIAESFRLATVAGSSIAGPALAYAQYDLLRRVHFALELCLQAISAELYEAGPRDVRSIARRFGRTPLQVLVDLAIATNAASLGDRTLGDFAADLNGQTLVERPIVNEARRSFPQSSQAAYALALLVAAVDAARVNAELTPREDGVARRAMAIVEGAQTRGAQDVLQDVLAFVVERHLFTTFRKMAAGQPCSLRFVSDGRRLQRTDQGTRAGMSGHRLTNVMVILSDLGFLTRSADGFSLTERGRALLNKAAS